jgi:putative ABC transport system substrate-binding protein
MTTRRKLLLALSAGTLSATLPTSAQQLRKVWRIGYFTMGSVQGNAAFLAAFREGMAALPWVEGRDFTFDARYAGGVAQAAPGMAADLIAGRPDLLLAAGDAAAHLLAERTKTIPIVFCIVQDPVGSGLAASLQHPGGNLTGLTTLSRELGAKRLQLVREAFPRAVQVVVLFDPANLGGVAEAEDIEAGAALLKIRVTAIEVRQATDIEPAFRRGAAIGADAYMLTQSSVINVQRKLIAELSLRASRPAIAPDFQFLQMGGLMSYGASFEDNYRRAAGYVDKILKGTKPGDLPIEQPIKFELAVSLKAAKAMGITFDKSFLARVDRVIE